MMTHQRRCSSVAAVILVMIAGSLGLAGCDWRGANSLPLPGTKGGGEGSFVVKAEMPDVTNIQPNSRVRVNDVTVGNVTKIERQGWHAVVTMTLDKGVDLPANATVKVGQTSLLGSLHVELAPPSHIHPEGKLHDGSLIPLTHAGAYPTTEQSLAALSLLLNGGGLGNLQDITKAFSVAFRGREQDLRSLIQQLDHFMSNTNAQTTDIIAATDSLNNLIGKFANQQPVIDRAIKTIPDALAVLRDERDNLAQALDQLGKLGALASDSVDKTKQALVQELKDLGPVLDALANADKSLTRSLSIVATYPFPKETLGNWIRGDYGNLTAVFDLTLSRLDNALFTGTRWEGNLTELEMQWGRTIGQLPSPVTSRNPLVVPYQQNQGP
jgi:phospholipid/cholesterol/gamma-HCH transport system substrate-binding protein